MATANDPDSFTSANFSFSVLTSHGFMVGMPAPPAARIAAVAAFMTSAFVPSPVKAAIPASLHALTRMSLYRISSSLFP